MANVISCVPATFFLGGAKYEQDANTYTVVHRVVFDSQPADWDEVRNALGTPAIGDALKPGDPRICKSKTPAMNGSPTQFLVTSEFEIPDDTLNATPGGPLSLPDKVSFDFGSETEEWFEDFSAPVKRATNTNHEAFETNPERTTGSFIIIIKGNRASVNPAQCASYLRPHAVNSAAVTVRGLTIGAGEGKMVGISGSIEAEEDLEYLAMTWQIAVAPSWDQVIENRGSYTLQSGVKTNIVMGTPPEKQSNWPLTENGGAIINPNVPPHKIVFKPYPRKPFNVFGWTA